MKNQTTPVVERAAEVRLNPTPATPPQRDESARSYKVICVSLYKADLRELDRKVADLKARGVRKATRSWLIRRALAELPLDALELLAKGARL